jgi:RNA polymerase sigma-70 factor (ECF subfamily)
MVEVALVAETVDTHATQASRVRELVNAHFSAVARLLRGLGVSEGEADDAAQQVFMVASRRLADIPRGRERAFLYRTAMNVAAHARRTVARRREDPEAEPPADSLSPEELLDRRRARECLDAILESMPMDLRATFVLFEIDEMPTAEIAEVLDLPVGTVASRLRRARVDFEERVRRWQARARAVGGAR